MQYSTANKGTMVLLAIHTKATKHHFFWLHFGEKKYILGTLYYIQEG